MAERERGVAAGVGTIHQVRTHTHTHTLNKRNHTNTLTVRTHKRTFPSLVLSKSLSCSCTLIYLQRHVAIHYWGLVD